MSTTKIVIIRVENAFLVETTDEFGDTRAQAFDDEKDLFSDLKKSVKAFTSQYSLIKSAREQEQKLVQSAQNKTQSDEGEEFL